MAMIVSCSSTIPITNSVVLIRRNSQSDLFSRNTNVSGKLTYIPFKLQKFISTLREAWSRPFDLCRAFVDSQSVYMQMDDIKASTLDQSWDLGQISPDCIATSGNFVLHQERMLTRTTSVTVLVMNALMLAAPLEALAETCETDKSFSMPLLLFVALIGATVGGLLARQRRGELERLNEQLRQINAALRRQAKIESYAPNLSYAPVGGRILENEVIVDSRKQDLTSRLKNGKNYLRNRNPEKAFSEFRAALELAQNLKDPIEEKKAARGLGASLQRQGKYREAITYHSMVLAISEREREDSGNTEAYGAIADCYTELGDLERAAKYYDQYIARLQSD